MCEGGSPYHCSDLSWRCRDLGGWDLCMDRCHIVGQVSRVLLKMFSMSLLLLVADIKLTVDKALSYSSGGMPSLA